MKVHYYVAIMLSKSMKHKSTTKMGIVGFLLIFFFSFLIPSVATPGTANALTDQEIATCAQFDGLGLAAGGYSLSTNPTYQNCINIGACTTRAGSGVGAIIIDCKKIATNTQQTADDKPTLAAIQNICGSSPSGVGDASLQAYADCAANVRKAYNDCFKNSGGTTTGNQDTIASNVAYCIGTKITGVNVTSLSAAILGGMQGQNTAYATAGAAADCIKNGGNINAAGNCDNQETSPPTCEAQFADPFTWVLCPLITGLISGVDAVRSILQSLLQIDITPDSAAYKDLFKAWSNVRIIGNVMLAIALLVIVFGESVGGGILEAYAVKKALPRILIAAILINLSFYIVLALNDIMNVLGSGIYSLMSVTLTGGGLHRVNVDILGGAEGTVAIGGIVATGIAAPALAGSAVLWLAAFVLLPALLIVLAGLFVIIIRQGLILVLLVLSPLAFALYALPNTEKYFKKWWEELSKAMLVYPIVMALFGASTMLSTLIGAADLKAAEAFKMIVQLIAALAPVMLIAFAFKMAGGLLGSLMESGRAFSQKAHQGILGNPNDERSFRRKVSRRLGSAAVTTRGDAIKSLSDRREASRNKAGDPSRRGRWAGRLADALNYGNNQADRAYYNRIEREQTRAQVETGNDDNRRAAFAERYMGTAAEGPPAGRKVGSYYGMQAPDGTYTHFSETDVNKAHSLINDDPSIFQSVAEYEAGKVGNKEQHAEYKRRFINLANSGNFSPNDVQGTWAGLKFANQAARKEDKFLSIKQNSSGKFEFGDYNHANMSNELVDSMGRGDFSRFRDTTAEVALQGWREANERVAAGTASEADLTTIENYEALAKHMQENYFSYGPAGADRLNREITAGDKDTPLTGSGTGASVRADNAWREFAQQAYLRGKVS